MSLLNQQQPSLELGISLRPSPYDFCQQIHHIYMDVEINRVRHSMELETGCETSVISQDIYKNQLHSQLPLTQSSHASRTYTNEVFRAVGDLSCTIRHNWQRHDRQVPISRGSSLFGRDFLHIFDIDWKTVQSQIHRVSNDNYSSKLDALLLEYEDVFRPPSSTDRIKGFKARVILNPDATPKFFKARPIPYAYRAAVDKELDLMTSTGVISPVDSSDWATPVVVVPKVDGRVRITGDFKVTVNAQLSVTQYPLASQDDIFANLTGSSVFSKLDGNNAYHQIELEDDCHDFLVISTHRGLYKYRVLPQGIASSPAIFQRFMDTMLEGIPKTGAFIDDVISGGTPATHLQLLRTILQQFRKYNYKLSSKKCQFFEREVTYLGHRVSDKGIETHPEKIQAVLKIPQPRNRTEVKSFLGVVNFYGKFLRNLSSICDPLHRLTRKNVPFNWTKECTAAVGKVKKLITTTPVLTMFNLLKPIGLSCDASPVGLGVVLFHREVNGFESPIAFASRLLSPTERNYSQVEKEGLAIVYGIKKYYKYLAGRQFTLITDHKPLISIFGPKSQLPPFVATRLHHWSLFLSQFQYDVSYRKSDDHGNADALSRLIDQQQQKDVPVPYHESCVNHVAEQQLGTLLLTAAKIQKATLKDQVLSKVLQLVLYGWPPFLREEDAHLQPYFHRRYELTINQGVLMWGLRVIIPPIFREQLLHQLHEAHLGIVRMKALARQHMYWPGIDSDIEKLCKSCQICQQSAPNPPIAPLHPWQYPEKPWQRLHMDLAGPFLNNNWLIIMDAHSKWPEVCCMHANTTSSAVITKLSEIIARFGVPEQLVTDNGRQFVSNEFEQFCKDSGIKHVLSSPYHPRTNGEAERFVRTFKEGMRSNDIPVPERLQRFLMAYRSTPHATTGVTPAELLQHQRLRTKLDMLHPDVSTTVRNSQLNQEKHFNRRAKSRSFNLQQNVWVQTYIKGKEKWNMGIITGKIGPVTYHVRVGDRILKRHSDQIRQATTTSPNPGGSSEQRGHPHNEDSDDNSSPRPTTSTKVNSP